MHTGHKNEAVAEKMKLYGNNNEALKMTHMDDMVSGYKDQVMEEEEYGPESA